MALAAARWYYRLLLVATVSAASDSSGSASDSDDCSGSSSGSSSGSGPKFYQLPIVDGVGARDFWIIFSMMIAFIIIDIFHLNMISSHHEPLRGDCDHEPAEPPSLGFRPASPEPPLGAA